MEAMPHYAINIEIQTAYQAEQSDPTHDHYVFSYTIKITNSGQVAAQLISRHWRIIDDHGKLIEVKGLGVVGHQPLLKPGESFEYTSGTPLNTAHGMMSGSYFFVAEDGERFEADIPEFELSMPRTLH
jgi:ApaG protein